MCYPFFITFPDIAQLSNVPYLRKNLRTKRSAAMIIVSVLHRALYTQAHVRLFNWVDERDKNPSIYTHNFMRALRCVK